MATIAQNTRKPSRRSGIRSEHVSHFLGRVAIYALLIIGAILILVPFLWTISTSLKTEAQTLQFPPTWMPNPFAWENYPTALQARPFDIYYMNSAFIAITSTIGQVISSAIVAFGFARMRFWGRNTLFLVVLSTMMIPFHVMIIPRFILFKELGWLNTYYPLILPNFFGSAFSIFLLRQYFMTISLDLDDAAKIDGAGYFRIFISIILPMSTAAMGVVGVFEFLESWRDFFGPLIYLTSDAKYTVPVGLNAFRTEYFTEWHLFMAASAVAMLVPLLVFFVAQKYFLGGIALVGSGGSKG